MPGAVEVSYEEKQVGVAGKTELGAWGAGDTFPSVWKRLGQPCMGF